LATALALSMLILSGAVPLATPAVRAAEPPPTADRPLPAVSVTPRGHEAWEAFDELARKGGPKVVMPGGPRALLVPVELRFKPVAGRELIEAVAAARKLKVAWVREGQCAVLYPGASDDEVERVRKDLASADAALRVPAAWRAGWLRDVRVVPLLLKAAKDADAEVVRQALIGLRREKWEVVLMLDETAADLLTAELASQDANERREAVSALGSVGKEKALALLEKALADQDNSVRWTAASALGSVGGEKALALLEKALADQDINVRYSTLSALGRVGGEKALALLEKALADQDTRVRGGAASVLGRVGGDRALALLEKAFEDAKVRSGVVYALGSVGGDKALALIEKALAEQDAHVRCSAASALGRVGGEKALALLEKALADQDDGVRWTAASALGRVGGEKALALLAKALASQDATVRGGASHALGNLGGEKARDLLLKQLAVEKDPRVLMWVSSTLSIAFLDDPAVEKALKDFKMPEAPKPEPRPQP